VNDGTLNLQSRRIGAEEEALGVLQPLRIQELSEAPADQPLFESLVHHHHYLGYTSSVGMNLNFPVRDRQGRPSRPMVEPLDKRLRTTYSFSAGALRWVFWRISRFPMVPRIQRNFATRLPDGVEPVAGA
jgi:hypothetical protein